MRRVPVMGLTLILIAAPFLDQIWDPSLGLIERQSPAQAPVRMTKEVTSPTCSTVRWQFCHQPEEVRIMQGVWQLQLIPGGRGAQDTPHVIPGESTQLGQIGLEKEEI